MKNKKVMMYVSIIFILLIIIGIGYLVYINLTGENEYNPIREYIPEEEITEEQLRKTNIELFFLNKETNILEKEIRSIDAKELLENPAKRIMELLIEGPNSDMHLRTIPEGTKINSIIIEKGIAIVDLSEEFIKDENLGKEKEEIIIESIKNSMAQLVEINSIKILIDGQYDKEFKDGNINFKENFIINN